jgi:dTDP-4-amino-4,6-dideoxygalactose transaminase
MSVIGLARNRVDNSGGTIFEIIANLFDRKDYIKEFEEEFASYMGTRYSIATCSGRYALALILKSLELKQGDEVIVPSYTFYVVPEIIQKLGFKVVFVDINSETANIDVAQIKKRITKRTRAIIVTHLFGRPAELDAILKLAKRKNIHIIEDCCQAHGTKYRGKRVGSFGVAGFFSFDTTKPINTFGGGIITTNDNKLAERIRQKIRGLPNLSKIELVSRIIRAYWESFLTTPFIFRVFIWPVLLLANITGIDFVGKYQKSKVKERMGVFKFSNVEAKMGIKQLQALDKNNNDRVFKANLLIGRVGSKARILKDDKKDFNIYTAFIIISNNRKELAKKLLIHGIDSETEMMQNCGRIFSNENFKCTDLMETKSLRVPLSYQINNGEVKYIASLVRRYSR